MTHTRKLMKIAGYSYAISIPKEIVLKYGWKEKQKLVVTDLGRGRLEVRDWKSK